MTRSVRAPHGTARRVSIVGLVVAAGALVACGDDSSDTGDNAATSASVPGTVSTTVSTEPDPTTAPSAPGTSPASTSPATPSPGSATLVDQAVADLAGRLDVETASIVVVSAEEVTWPDRSLGCPQPGMMYPQVLTDGTRIVLEAEGRTYSYHAGPAGEPFLCEQPVVPKSG